MSCAQHLTVAVAISLATCGQISAGVCTPNQFYYLALDDVRAVLVAKGEIIAIPPVPPGVNDVQETFDFKVSAVIYGDESHAGKTIKFDEVIVDWPDTLVPFEVGCSVILVLHPVPHEAKRVPGTIAPPRTNNAFYIDGVLPTSRVTDEQSRDRAGLVATLKRHLTPILTKETEPERLREAILLLSGIADASDVGTLAPLADHKDEWVARAALAAMVRASPEGKHMDRAIDDMQQVLRKTPADHSTERTYGSRSAEWRTLGLLFTHYHYLAQDGGKTSGRYLPLNRVVAAACMDSGYAVHYGLTPVCKHGNGGDVNLVRRFLSDEDSDVRAMSAQAIERWTRK